MYYMFACVSVVILYISVTNFFYFSWHMIPTIRKHRAFGAKHIDKKLLKRMMVYFIMSLVIFTIMIYEVVIWSAPVWIVFIAVVIWLLLGSVTHRIFRISWHEDEKKVISRIDRTGIIILVIYILFSIFRGKIIAYFFQWSAVLAITMSLVFGLMAGRVYGMRKRIMAVLQEQGISH